MVGSDVFPIENSPLNFGDMTLTSFFGGDIPWGIFLRLVPMPQWMVGAHEVESDVLPRLTYFFGWKPMEKYQFNRQKPRKKHTWAMEKPWKSKCNSFKQSSKLGGGDSTIFCNFQPIWGRFPFWLNFWDGLKPPTRKPRNNTWKPMRIWEGFFSKGNSRDLQGRGTPPPYHSHTTPTRIPWSMGSLWEGGPTWGSLKEILIYCGRTCWPCFILFSIWMIELGQVAQGVIPYHLPMGCHHFVDFFFGGRSQLKN